MIAVHDTQKKFLLQSLKLKRLSHAYIFNGEEGTGKDGVAEWFSEKLKSEVKDSWDFQCWQVYPEHPEGGGRGSIKVNQIEKIKERTSLKLSRNGYQLVIIHGAELMNFTAQDALLKVLEEPKNRTIFILLVDALHLLRDTIRSRCQLIHFSPLNFIQSIEWLSNFDLEKEKALEIALMGQGRIDIMLELKDNPDVLTKRLERWHEFQKIQESPLYQRFDLAEKISQSRELVDQFLTQWLVYLRSIIIIKSFDIEAYSEISAKADFLTIAKTAEKIDKIENLFKNVSLNKKLAIEQALI